MRELSYIKNSLNEFYNNSTNLFDYYFRTARVTDVNLQLSGGAERVTYNIGLGYYTEKGVLKGTGFNRLKLLSNVTIKPMEKMDGQFAFLSRSNGSQSFIRRNEHSFV